MVNVGTLVYKDAEVVATKPKWMAWDTMVNNRIKGNATLPSGYRRISYIGTDAFSKHHKDNVFVNPVSVPASNMSWRAMILADNGSYVIADGTGKLPTIGTPVVRLAKDAPARAVLRIPVAHGARNVRSSSYAGWSDGHPEAIKRGQEMTVEFNGPNGMTMVFRGMIYQVSSGETVEIVAYDRLMDLYQFSDQYQSAQGTHPETLPLNSTTASDYVYIASQAPGTLTVCKVTSELSINSLSYAIYWAYEYHMSNLPNYWVMHDLPAFDGQSPKKGCRITRVSTSSYVFGSGSSLGGGLSVRVALFHVSGSGAVTMLYRTSVQTMTSGTDVQSVWTKQFNWDVDWLIEGDPSEYYLGVFDHPWSSDYHAGSMGVMTKHTTTTFYRYLQADGDINSVPPYNIANWTLGGITLHPEIAIRFTNEDIVPVNDVSIAGTSVSIPKSDVTTPSNDCISTVSPAYEAYIDYITYNGTSLVKVISDLIDWAGLVPNIDQNADMGSTTFYTSSTYDYLACIQEIIKAANYGIRATIAEAGKIDVYPKHTLSDAVVASFTTRPGGSAEHAILSHNITAHWMAEKATQAYISEDATSSGLPVALETDDRLMDNSLVKVMQSSLRSIISDKSLGTQDLQAIAAGGKMVQLHTNVFEGEMVLAGYRLDLWSLIGNYTGGNPISVDIPEYSASGTAIPTEIEFGDGVTRVALDNIRTADRSEMANSMGLTADAISNNASALPSTVYVFARLENRTSEETGMNVSGKTVASVCLYHDNVMLARQSDANYIKVTVDKVGYYHIMAVFPASAQPTGYATSTPITYVTYEWSGIPVDYAVTFDNPKYAYAGQSVIVDIRMRKA